MSKILERLINKRLTAYLEKNALLSPCQYGFRTGRSTDDAVNKLTNAIIQDLDKNQKCLAVFLDITKAFDTVNHELLIQKLENLGIRDIPLKLFQSYLYNRKQRVKIKNWISNELNIDYGVPQGSILGPTLFLVYVNDLCQIHLDNGKLLSFADDTALYFKGNTWTKVFLSAQNSFNMVYNWLTKNRLALNADKTKFITFALRSNLLPSFNFSIKAHSCSNDSSDFKSPTPPCKCQKIQRTDSIKYLGVVMDQLLTFKPHIDLLVTRLRKLIYIFKNLRHIADQRTLKIVYFSICQSILSYCITSWGGIAKTHILELERTQRAILKVSAFFTLQVSHTGIIQKMGRLNGKADLCIINHIKKTLILTIRS